MHVLAAESTSLCDEHSAPEEASVVTEPFLICRVSSMRPSYVSCVHIGVTTSTSLSKRIISSMPPLPAAPVPPQNYLSCLHS